MINKTIIPLFIILCLSSCTESVKEEHDFQIHSANVKTVLFRDFDLFKFKGIDKIATFSQLKFPFVAVYYNPNNENIIDSMRLYPNSELNFIIKFEKEKGIYTQFDSGIEGPVYWKNVTYFYCDSVLVIDASYDGQKFSEITDSSIEYIKYDTTICYTYYKAISTTDSVNPHLIPYMLILTISRSFGEHYIYTTNYNYHFENNEYLYSRKWCYLRYYPQGVSKSFFWKYFDRQSSFLIMQYHT